MKIIYRSGYKYQLKKSYSVSVPEMKVANDIVSDFILLRKDGILIIRSGYAWDGPSGPALDTKNFMRASLVHDALYQLIREGYLEAKIHKPLADKTLKTMCLQDGMSRLRAALVYNAVKYFGDYAVDPASEHPLQTAP